MKNFSISLYIYLFHKVTYWFIKNIIAVIESVYMKSDELKVNSDYHLRKWSNKGDN